MKRYEVVFTADADAQLRRLESYLADRFYPGNAEQYVQRLIEACRSIGIAPHIGSQCDDLIPGLRSTGFERRATNYFKVLDEQVLIVSIRYAGKSFDSSG